METKRILYYAAEGSTSEFETQVKKIEKSGRDLLQERDEKGRNVLFHAAITDNVKNFLHIIKKCRLSMEDLLNVLDNNQATVLHWATQFSSLKVIKEIITIFANQAGRMILARDFESVTPLHISATKFNTKIIKSFIDNLSSTDDVYRNAQDKHGRSPLHYAATKVNLEAIRIILETDGNCPQNPILGFPIDHRDKTGVIPLMCAVGVNLPQAAPVIRLLEKKKPVSKTRQNRDGLTALHIAVAARNLEAVQLLIELGCSIDLVDNEQRTPLHYAAEHGYPEIVRFLITHGARNSTRDNIGATPAHYAAQFSVDCLKIIFEASKIAEVKDNENRSCLMWAVCTGNLDVMNHLIQQNNAPDRREIDKYGFTALHLAAMVGNGKICKFLLNQGWSLSERDNHGNTALHLAAGRGHTDVLRCLMAAGANISDIDEVGRTPIFWACMGEKSHTLLCMIKELRFEWRTPGSSGTNNARPITDNYGRTALHAAANAGASVCIGVLLSIEQEDNVLSSPLVGWRDQNGETALHGACLIQKIDCVLALLKGGSAINAFGRPMKTPLDCAENSPEGLKRTIVINHLRSLGALTYNELLHTAATVIQRAFRRFWRMGRVGIIRKRIFLQ